MLISYSKHSKTSRRSDQSKFDVAKYPAAGHGRTFALIVYAHPYCARSSHATSCIESARQVVKWIIIGQMAIALTLRGFNILDVRWPLFFFRWVVFSADFPLFAKKWKNLSSRILNILQNAPSNSVYLTSAFSCASVSNAFLRVKVAENDGNIWND